MKINQRKFVQKNSQTITKHIHFEKIDSTNTWAKLHSQHWASEGVTLITASEQTTGRGRFKRCWISPPHVNIYATFCFWMHKQNLEIGYIPQLLALASVQTLEKYSFTPKIKWPNDILLNHKKMGGILCETIMDDQRRGVICGIGLNVNMSQEALSMIDRPATSLLVEGQQTFDLELILENLQQLFVPYLQKFMKQGFHSFFPLFESKSSLTKGQFVHFHDNQTLIKAQFERLHPDGSVELLFPHGIIKKFYAGEFIDN